MSGDTRVAVLTPHGTGAIASIEVAGPRAWELARLLFHPSGKPLPTSPELHRFWYGTLGKTVGDEVILAVASVEPTVNLEVHCHGGQQVVQWIVEQFLQNGCSRTDEPGHDSDPWFLLTRAPTLRTASILLDQAHGAFAAAIGRILELLASNPSAAIEPLGELVQFAPVGRHLVEPWKVVIAGPPNVGKSSLMNALAGFQRAIVSETAGTTRDLVTVPVAFDGWPVELTDTAGLRDAVGLEAEGITRAQRVLSGADLVVWVVDSSLPKLDLPDAETASMIDLQSRRCLLAMNKSDLSPTGPPSTPVDAIHLSARNGNGVPELVAAITSRLVPDVPAAGAAVPFSAYIADLVVSAYKALASGRIEESAELLRDCAPAS